MEKWNKMDKETIEKWRRTGLLKKVYSYDIVPLIKSLELTVNCLEEKFPDKSTRSEYAKLLIPMVRRIYGQTKCSWDGKKTRVTHFVDREDLDKLMKIIENRKIMESMENLRGYHCIDAEVELCTLIAELFCEKCTKRFFNLNGITRE